jgi:hypothetical protein
LPSALRSDAASPTEPSGNGYQRLAVPAALTSFSGTQGSTSNTASSGTSGTVYNLSELAWPESTGAWGNLQSVWFMDAASGGNVWISIDLTTPVNVSVPNFTLRFAPGQLSFQIDN